MLGRRLVVGYPRLARGRGGIVVVVSYAAPSSEPNRPALAFVAGAAVGMLGGLIGLGGAQFRLPLLIGLFALVAH